MRCAFPNRPRHIEKALKHGAAGDVATAVTVLNSWGAQARDVAQPSADMQTYAGVHCTEEPISAISTATDMHVL